MDGEIEKIYVDTNVKIIPKQPDPKNFINFMDILNLYIINKIHICGLNLTKPINVEIGYGGLKVLQEDFSNIENVKRIRFYFLILTINKIKTNIFGISSGNIVGILFLLYTSFWNACGNCKKKCGIMLKNSIHKLNTHLEALEICYFELLDLLYNLQCNTCKLMCEEIGKILQQVFTELENVFNINRKILASKMIKKTMIDEAMLLKTDDDDLIIEYSLNAYQERSHILYIINMIRLKNKIPKLVDNIFALFDKHIMNNPNYITMWFGKAKHKPDSLFSSFVAIWNRHQESTVFVKFDSPMHLEHKSQLKLVLERATDFIGWLGITGKIFVDVPVFMGLRIRIHSDKIMKIIREGDNFLFTYTSNPISLIESSGNTLVASVCV